MTTLKQIIETHNIKSINISVNYKQIWYGDYVYEEDSDKIVDNIGDSFSLDIEILDYNFNEDKSWLTIFIKDNVYRASDIAKHF